MKVTQLNGLAGGGLSAFPCGDSKTFIMHAGDTIASPCSSVFLGKFQGLQRAINAYSRKFGVGDTVKVDGDLGPATLRQAKIVWGHGFDFGKPGWPAVRPVGILQLAGLDIYTLAFSRAAGASVDVSPDADTAPSFVVGEGTITIAPRDRTPKKAGLSGALFIAGAAGFAAYKLIGRRKG